MRTERSKTRARAAPHIQYAYRGDTTPMHGHW